MRKVALVGSAQATRHQVPIDDMTWEIWAMPWDNVPRVDRYFEPHADWRTKSGPFDTAADYVEHVQALSVPVFLREEEPDVPTSMAYPYEDVFALLRCRYLESTIGHMLALAILEGVDRIGLFGVDMANDEEYAYQKPNAEFLIGFARGRGIGVYVPQQSSLLKSRWPAGLYGAA